MGTSYDWFSMTSKIEDHPHAYGDKCAAFSIAKAGEGSSPRVWGQVSYSVTADRPTRIIPTRMGTSFRNNAETITLKDHPHAYGDKNLRRFFMWDMLGSSPRVWGQESKHRSHLDSLRIIPTRMGTSSGADLRYCAFRDHPHAYGDKYSDFSGFSPLAGSSPRVWGQVFLQFADLACVQDHPHAYGDKQLLHSGRFDPRGSSPRVWGQDPLDKHTTV